MVSKGRTVVVGLFAILGTAICSCDNYKEPAYGDNSGGNTSSAGSGGAGAIGANSKGSNQGGESSNTVGNGEAESNTGTGGSPSGDSTNNSPTGGNTGGSPRGGNTGDSTSTPVCGNGVVEGDEQCDCGSDGLCTTDELKGATCEALENGTGTVRCDANCMLDFSMCTSSVDIDTGPYGTDSSVTVDAGQTGDCTPVQWNNPGNVPNPTVEKVPADSGRGFPFEMV